MEVLGSIYTEVSDRFQKGIIKGGGEISRCVKAEKHDLGVVFMEQIILDGSQRGLENGKWRTYTDIMPSITAREYKEPRKLLSNQATQIEKQIDIATTLMARDYKGFGN